MFSGFKAYLGGGPVYAALVSEITPFSTRPRGDTTATDVAYVLKGNHDTWPQAFDAPHSIQPEQLANQFEWNYAHLAE